MKRVIHTVNRTLTLGQYVTMWQMLLVTPIGTEFQCGLTTWGPCSREEILREIRDGIHDRINRHLPGFNVGRKWDSDWQRIMGYSARFMNAPRTIIDYLPPELSKRFAHRLRSARL